MDFFGQIIWGSMVLCICCLSHFGLLLISIPLITAIGDWARRNLLRAHIMLIIGYSFLVVVAIHTVQVWIWAFALQRFDLFDGFAEATYFSLVTYTTLGYGDIVLEPDYRIFGAFAAVTGLLSFGISTAFVVALLNRLFRETLGADNPGPLDPHERADAPHR